MTWNPPPDGIINVDVWSSKAGQASAVGISLALAPASQKHTEAIRVRTNLLRLLAVLTRLTDVGAIVAPSAAVGRLVVLRTGGKARVE